eukprot:165646-Chlamydomonas_euryale.AAC.8
MAVYHANARRPSAAWRRSSAAWRRRRQPEAPPQQPYPSGYAVPCVAQHACGMLHARYVLLPVSTPCACDVCKPAGQPRANMHGFGGVPSTEAHLPGASLLCLT